MNASLLFDQRFVAVFPSLVRALDGDLTGAAVLQAIHFRLQPIKGSRDQKKIELPLTEIADDIGISKPQAQRAMVKLIDAGLVIVHGDQIRGARRTIGIDYEALAELGQSGTKSHHSQVVRDHTTTDAIPNHKRCETASPILYIEKEKNKKADSTKSNAGDVIAKAWWDAQNPKPAGGQRAWFALRNAVRANVEAGWDPDRVAQELARLNRVPSVAQLDAALRNPRTESWSERKAREEREEREAIARRREQERLANLERERQRDEEAARAVPPPPEFRQAVARLRGRVS